MIPVTQTTFGEGEGNCLQACLASILDVNIERIPWFGEDSSWTIRMNEWLFQFDIVAIQVDVDGFTIVDSNLLGYHIIAGPSPRGDYWHSVVGYKGKMVHDPHPSGDGLAEVKSFTFLVKRFDVPYAIKYKPSPALMSLREELLREERDQ